MLVFYHTDYVAMLPLNVIYTYIKFRMRRTAFVTVRGEKGINKTHDWQ